MPALFNRQMFTTANTVSELVVLLLYLNSCSLANKQLSLIILTLLKISPDTELKTVPPCNDHLLLVKNGKQLRIVQLSIYFDENLLLLIGNPAACFNSHCRSLRFAKLGKPALPAAGSQLKPAICANAS